MWIKIKPKILNLSKKLNKSWGRNSSGKITVRRRGGSFYKPKTKLVDFSGFLWNSFGVVHSLEVSKINSSYLALVVYSCGVASYIIAPRGLRPGNFILNSDSAHPHPSLGFRLLLKNIPLNTKLHNIESFPRSGGKFSRAAGSWAKIIEKTESHALLAFRNGKRRRFSLNCAASIGMVSNLQHKKFITKSKAGDSRRMGIRPWVRGVAQNAVDHPHGGGKGKKSPPATNYNFVRLLPKSKKTARKK